MMSKTILISTPPIHRHTQSSWRLFWRGVPVINMRLREWRMRMIWDNIEFSFLMRWASSMIMYCQEIFLNCAFSNKQISYEVMQTSKSIGLRRLSMSSLYTISVMLVMNLATMVTHDTYSSFLITMENKCIEFRDPFWEFALPIVQSRLGNNHQMGSIDATNMLQIAEEWNRLQGFTKTLHPPWVSRIILHFLSTLPFHQQGYHWCHSHTKKPSSWDLGPDNHAIYHP